MRYLRTTRFTLLAFLAAALFLSSCKTSTTTTTAKAPAWVKLGERMADLRRDHDEIPVTAMKGDFKALKLRVMGSPIFLNSAVIHYGNGDKQRLQINRRISAGSETRAFDLPGRDRVIRMVALNYRSAPGGKPRAKVVLLGRR